MLRTILAASSAIAIALPAMVGGITSSVDGAELSQGKQTALGLYVTALDTAAALEADPGIVLVDVPTRAEFSYVGNPDLVDQNVPYRFLSDRLNEKRGSYAYDINENFVGDIGALMAREGKGKDDPVILICRSGGRSAAAVDTLAAAGYTQVYTVVDGFEGGKDRATGLRTVEGWRNAGLPWGYGIASEVACRPAK